MTVSPTRSRTSARAAATALAAAVAIGAGLLSAPAAIAAPAAAPGAAPAADHHSLTSTVSAGKGARDIAFDSSDNRVYVPVDRGSLTPGAITWLDGTTGEPSGRYIELADAEPQTLVVDASAHALYVLHYRTGTLTVIDTDTNTVTKVIPGLPLFPGGMELDTVTGDLYVSDDGIITVDPRAGTVSAEVPISTQRFPRITDMVYDAANRLLWISEGRSGVITAFSSVTKTWMNTVSTPIATFQVNGEPIGGGPKSLAIDEQLGHLYVDVDPSFVDDWEDTKLVTIDTATARFRGAPIDLGDTTRELAVNPSTHEVYASNGFSNTLSVVSPATWSVAQTIDFTALGVTNGTGAGDADIWGLAANTAGDRVFISHPYTARVSVIDRTGSADAVTELPYSPGQGPVDPQPPTSEVWPGPAGATLAPAPADAIATTAQSLSWSVSDYARAWTGDLYGAVTKGDEDRYTFTGGTGWSSPSTGETQLAWNDGFRLRPYPVLAPQVKMTFGNPLLSAAADGSGTLSFDVAWEVSETDVSNGFTRVDVATFAAGAIQAGGESVSVTAQPEFEGRPFTDEDGEVYASSYPASFLTYLDPQIRGWWYTTGASLDKNKHPNPVSLTFTRAAAPTGPTDPTTPTDPGTTPSTPGNPGTPGTPGVSNGDGNGNGNGNGNGAANVGGTSADPASALVSTGASLTGGVAGLALLMLGGLFLLRRRATARAATPAAPTATTATTGEQ